jgi:hypothetical protein
MKFKHIVKEGEDLNTLNKHISDGKNAFILVYSDDCGYCVEVLPKWKKIEQVLSTQYKNIDSIIVACVNIKLLSHIPYFGDFKGVPSMKYVYDYGKKTETYEESDVQDKNRETSSFVNWIEIKLDNHHSHIDKNKKPQQNKTTRNKKQKHVKVGGGNNKTKSYKTKSYNKNKKKPRRSRK